MNKRIRELAKKSGFSLDSTGIYTAKLEHLPITENMEKFAELIVQDCIRNLEIHATCFDGDVGRGVRTAARLTKEHFGVKK
jgi:hypothetical protein